MASFDTIHDATDHTGITGVDGLASGTSFPGSPANNDLFHRTDLDRLYYYDGTRWLSLQEFSVTGNGYGTITANSSTAVAVWRGAPTSPATDMWLIDLTASTFVAATNSGAHYWIWQLEYRDAANTATSIVTFNSSAHTQANWVMTTTAIGAVLNTAARTLAVTVTQNGTPGSAHQMFNLRYRLIAT